MSIELLWIIPAIALASLLFLITLLAQKQDTQNMKRSGSRLWNTDDFSHRDESDKGDDGGYHNDSRIGKLEDKITRLNASITHQQLALDNIEQQKAAYDDEINDLRNQLRSLHKEYDIAMSENYSLRSRVKKLKKEIAQNNNDITSVRANVSRAHFADHLKETSSVNMQLYGDTRKMKVIDLEDTGEFDIAELN